jgi:hypothetical protein
VNADYLLLLRATVLKLEGGHRPKVAVNSRIRANVARGGDVISSNASRATITSEFAVSSVMGMWQLSSAMNGVMPGYI